MSSMVVYCTGIASVSVSADGAAPFWVTCKRAESEGELCVYACVCVRACVRVFVRERASERASETASVCVKERCCEDGVFSYWKASQAF
eukprot:3936601-Rhodomonas_salina.1